MTDHLREWVEEMRRAWERGPNGEEDHVVARDLVKVKFVKGNREYRQLYWISLRPSQNCTALTTVSRRLHLQTLIPNP